MDKPEALRLADEHLSDEWIAGTRQWRDEAAAELRRLHALNGELAENLEKKSVAIQRIWKERDELRKVNAELLEALKDLVLNATEAMRTGGWVPTPLHESFFDALGNANNAIAKAEEKV